MAETCKYFDNIEDNNSNTLQEREDLKKEIDKNCLSYFKDGIDSKSLIYPDDYEKILNNQPKGLSDSDLIRAKKIILENLKDKIDDGFLGEIDTDLLFDVLDNYSSLHNEMGGNTDHVIPDILLLLKNLKDQEADFINYQKKNNPESIGKDIYDRYGGIDGLIEYYEAGQAKINSPDYED